MTVVDDYGHHPTEILATLKAARECGFGRVHVLFQPHRYTRTRDLMAEFTAAFGNADTVEMLDIYAASETPIEGIDGTGLAAAIQLKHPGRVRYAGSMAAGVESIVREAKPGDAVLTLGAGNVSQGSALVLTALEERVGQVAALTLAGAEMRGVSS